MKEVIRAGKALRGTIEWNPDEAEAIRSVFQVANSWRASHAFPMHRMRSELHGRMSALKIKGLTAARLKQMSSVRGKLRRISSNLRQMQDLGGCRAILPSIDNASSLVNAIRNGFSHELKREDSYMDEPRSSGYRSHHLVFAFCPRNAEEEPFRGRLIELQIRSRLQHCWATAVEAVGMYRNENMKAGLGDASWLRLFELMSLEFALSEGRKYAQGERSERISEIAQIAGDLQAEQTLNALSHAVTGLDRFDVSPNNKPRYCHIEYFHRTNQVSVRLLDGPSKIGGALDELELPSDRSSNKSSVVVELDKIENLRKAYPNYFGDVQLFTKNLSEVVHGGRAREYKLPPVNRVPPPPKEIPDDSWLRYPNRQNRRWKD
tara:strand:+ start:1302 stop:2432 length:1131 start_codon:yes stop_codon:yes gene_type:complete